MGTGRLFKLPPQSSDKEIRVKNKVFIGGLTMPRIARMFVKGEELAYYIISRTVLDGYVIQQF